MNIAQDDVFGGLTGPALPVEEFAFGQGITISRTFAHLMAPFLMAFSPAEPGKAHPAPLRAAKGGFGFDIVMQLHIPADFQDDEWFDRLNTIWWFTALLRFVASPSILAAAVADRPFHDGSSASDIEIIPIEVESRRLLISRQDAPELTVDHLEWVKKVWHPAGKLMRESPAFNTLFQASDQALFARTPSLALLSLWGALEALFSPARAELRFRVSLNISAFLEKPGATRLALQKKIAKLYDARSAAAHGSANTQPDELIETFVLVKRVLAEILDRNEVPSRDELEKLLFCVEDGSV